MPRVVNFISPGSFRGSLHVTRALLLSRCSTAASPTPTSLYCTTYPAPGPGSLLGADGVAGRAGRSQQGRLCGFVAAGCTRSRRPVTTRPTEAGCPSSFKMAAMRRHPAVPRWLSKMRSISRPSASRRAWVAVTFPARSSQAENDECTTPSWVHIQSIGKFAFSASIRADFSFSPAPGRRRSRLF